MYLESTFEIGIKNQDRIFHMFSVSKTSINLLTKRTYLIRKGKLICWEPDRPGPSQIKNFFKDLKLNVLITKQSGTQIVRCC